MRSNRFAAVLAAADELALQLEAELGRDFREKYPPRTDPAAMAKLLATAEYRMWLAWAAITQAKHLFSAKRDDQAATKVPCPECQGKGKHALVEAREDGPAATKTRTAKVAAREVACGTCAGAGKVEGTPDG